MKALTCPTHVIKACLVCNRYDGESINLSHSLIKACLVYNNRYDDGVGTLQELSHHFLGCGRQGHDRELINIYK